MRPILGSLILGKNQRDIEVAFQLFSSFVFKTKEKKNVHHICNLKMIVLVEKKGKKYCLPSFDFV